MSRSASGSCITSIVVVARRNRASAAALVPGLLGVLGIQAAPPVVRDGIGASWSCRVRHAASCPLD